MASSTHQTLAHWLFLTIPIQLHLPSYHSCLNMTQPLNLQQLPSPQPQIIPTLRDPLAVRYKAMEAMAALNNLSRTLNNLQNKVLAQALMMEDDPQAQELGLRFLQRIQEMPPLLDMFRDAINQSFLPPKNKQDNNDTHTSSSAPSPPPWSEMPSGVQANKEQTMQYSI